MIPAMPMDTAYFAPSALLPDGWASAVRMEVDADGLLSVSYTHLTLPTTPYV